MNIIRGTALKASHAGSCEHISVCLDCTTQWGYGAVKKGCKVSMKGSQIFMKGSNPFKRSLVTTLIPRNAPLESCSLYMSGNDASQASTKRNCLVGQR